MRSVMRPERLWAVLLTTLCLGLGGHRAEAAHFTLDGYGDVRLIVPSSQDSWIHGGLGKFRFGQSSGDPDLRIGEVVAEGIGQLTPSIMAFASIRYDQDQRREVDFIEAYVRYRPVSTTRFRWSVKLGMFFPPISLENGEVGWTSGWTITPSVINSWVGEELRTIGGEGRLEYRTGRGTIEAVAAVYGFNDPAGILLAFRGWAFNDRPTTYADHPRLPDALAAIFNAPVPFTTLEFKEIDDRPGYYLGLRVDDERFGRIELMRYDNRANPEAFRRQFAWRTKFWSAGYTRRFGMLTLMAQGMTGLTYVEPVEDVYNNWNFDAAYLLAGLDLGKWRVALRGDVFSTDRKKSTLPSTLSQEDGNGLTGSVSWFPKPWLRLSAEAIRAENDNTLRTSASLKPKIAEKQLQFLTRVYF